MRETGDYAHGSIIGHVLRLALPVMVAELVHVLYNIVDRVYIGHIPGVGTAALSGVGIAFPLITLINAFAGICGTGGAPLCSIERGKHRDDEAQHIMENAFTLLLGMGLALTIVLFLLRRPALTLLGADESSLPYADAYFSIYVAGTVFVMISLGMNPFITMLGHSVTGMVTIMIGASLNIVLDPLFMFTFGMGIKGAAVATVISQFCSALWVVKSLRTKSWPLSITRLSLDGKVVRKILALGAPGFMFKATNSLTQAVANITLRLYGGPEGLLFISSMAVINSLREVVSLPTTSFANSSQPIMGYNYGAKRYSRIRQTIGTITLVTLSVNLLNWALVQFFPAALARCFTSDSELIRVCVPSMRIYFAVFFMMSFQTIGQNTFVAMNCPKRAVFFSLFRKAILVVPLTLLLPQVGFGVHGVFVAEAVSQIVGASATFGTMVATIYRKLRRTPDGEPLQV